MLWNRNDLLRFPVLVPVPTIPYFGKVLVPAPFPVPVPDPDLTRNVFLQQQICSKSCLFIARSSCAARAFYDCPAIISHRPRSQNISKEAQLNPEKDSRIKRPRSQVSLEKSSQTYKPLDKWAKPNLTPDVTPHPSQCLGECIWRVCHRVGKNPGFFKKTQPSGFFGFFWFFWGFLGFLGFFWVFLVFFCPDERVFRFFFSFTNTFRCIQTLNYNHSY